MPISKNFVNRLSLTQRSLLIRHVALGEVPVVLAASGLASRMALVGNRLIAFDMRRPPRFTRLTDLGREAAAVILGEYADALVAAGCLEGTAKIDALAKLRAMKALRSNPNEKQTITDQLAETIAEIMMPPTE